MTRKAPSLIIGNWKMHKTIAEALSFVEQFLSLYEKVAEFSVGLAVPYTMIHPLAQKIGKDHHLMIGGQNMNDCTSGAFTGEIAAEMLQDAGASFVLLGHSERRILYKEDDAFINRKLKRAVQAGIKPILCVGETKIESSEGKTEEVLERQLKEALKDIDPKELGKLAVAYEPIWAIGNGEAASPAIAQERHHFCREILSTLLNKEMAEQIIIQYGGSVTTSNAQNFLAEPDINGLLIGGASLSLDSFLQIVNDEYSKNQQ